MAIIFSGERRDAVRYATSWVLSPLVLGIIRLVFATYQLVSIVFLLVYNSIYRRSEAPYYAAHYWSYFTSLSYWGLTFYMLFAGAHSLSFYFSKPHHDGTGPGSGKPWLARWPRWLLEAHSVLYTTVTVFPILVTAVYWALIFDGIFQSQYDAFAQITQHVLNTAAALFEIVAPRTQARPIWHAVIIIVVLGAYLGLAFLTIETQKFYVYGFLDREKNGNAKVAIYIVGILIGSLVAFTLVSALIWLRVLATERWGKREGNFSTKWSKASTRGDAESESKAETGGAGASGIVGTI